MQVRTLRFKNEVNEKAKSRREASLKKKKGKKKIKLRVAHVDILNFPALNTAART